MKDKLIIIGAGGHALSVIDSLNEDYEIIGFIDEKKKIVKNFRYPIIGSKIEDIKDKKEYNYFIAIGNNKDREKWFKKINRNNLNIISIIDKTAIISQNAKIGRGVFIGKAVIINSGVEIGENCIINTRALIEHGCKIKDNVNISTNSTLNGDVVVNNNAFIGSCSVVNGQITIGKNSIIGSGSVVIKNIEENVTVAGVPTRIIEDRGNV